MNPNTSNLDPTARSFNAHHYTQTQNQGNVYPIGSSLTGMGNIQTGLQPPLGARTAFGGMSTTSSQPGDRFPAGFNQQLNQYQQAQSRHPGLNLSSYVNNPAARSQFGSQLGLQGQSLSGNRTLMGANLGGQQFGNVTQNQGIQGLPQWSGGGQASITQSNLNSLSSVNRMPGLSPQHQLAQVRNMNPLGQGLNRDLNAASLSGLLQSRQNPNPSHDLLNMMHYGRTQQNPYSLMSQIPQMQTSMGGSGFNLPGLPLERPGDQSLYPANKQRPRIEASEFPSLSGVSTSSSFGARLNALTLSNPTEVETEKNPSQEEYPALSVVDNPGGKVFAHGPIGRSPLPLGTLSPQETSSASTSVPESTSQTYFHANHNMSASVQDSLKNIQAGRVSRSSPPPVLRSPTALQKSISALSIQPQSSSTAHDRFSLLGLNSVIRMVNEDLSMLALGQDLTVLGLKLDHPGKDLHKTFISPWSDHQAPNPKQDFEIPACYDNPPEKLRQEHLSKFKDDTLFFIFYSSPGKEEQIVAATTLVSRGLMWHKDRKQWFMRVPNINPQKFADGERGSYYFFDTTQWKYVQKDNVLLKYEAVETGSTLAALSRAFLAAK